MLHRAAKIAGLDLAGDGATGFDDIAGLGEERREAIGVLTQHMILVGVNYDVFVLDSSFVIRTDFGGRVRWGPSKTSPWSVPASRVFVPPGGQVVRRRRSLAAGRSSTGTVWRRGGPARARSGGEVAQRRRGPARARSGGGATWRGGLARARSGGGAVQHGHGLAARWPSGGEAVQQGRVLAAGRPSGGGLGAGRRTTVYCGSMAPRTDWNPLLRGEFEKGYWKELQDFVRDERTLHEVFPPQEEVFAALHLTSYASVKVLILGQDPYHGPRQAHGLCFSVRPGVAKPPSLVNIFNELRDDIGAPVPDHGSLQHWARQGVLLLNATLTVRAHRAASHQGMGWERFTDEVIQVVNDKAEMVVFILWGASARRKKSLVDTSRHTIIESAHPSPLSARGGFFGSRPFSRANTALVAAGREPVDWAIPELPSEL